MLLALPADKEDNIQCVYDLVHLLILESLSEFISPASMLGYRIGAEINDSFCIWRMRTGATERMEGKRAVEKGPEK